MDTLAKAIKNGASLDHIKELSKICEPCFEARMYGNHHLKLAFMADRFDVCNFLLEYGETHVDADEWIKKKEWFKNSVRSSIKYSIQNKKYDRLRMIVKHRFVAITSMLCKINDLEACQILVKYGADVNGLHDNRDCDFNHSLLCCRNIEVSRYLLEHGASVHLTYDDGFGLLHSNNYCPSLDEIDLFLEFGADPNLVSTYGNTPLATHKDVEKAKKLVQAGADVNIQVNGFSVLHKCVGQVHRSPAMIDYCQGLIELGADVMARDNNGLTPLNYVVDDHRKNYAPNVFNMLVNYGAVCGVAPIFTNCQMHVELLDRVEFNFGPCQELVNALLSNNFDRVKFKGIDLLNNVSMFIQGLEMVQVCEELGYVFQGQELVHFINQDKIEVMEHLKDQLTMDWWKEYVFGLKVQSVAMLELLQAPINWWHISNDSLKKQLSIGMTDLDVEEKGCPVALEIVEIRHQRMDWIKVFIRGQGWFFDLPRQMVPKVVSFMV